MVYDEGFELRFEHETFFAFSKYELNSDENYAKDDDDEQTKGYRSKCDETFKGWFIINGKYGCFVGKKRDKLKDNTEFISKLQEHKNMRIVQRDDLVNDKKVNVMTPLEEKKQEKPTEDEKKGFLDRFKKDLSLYDIPHTNYLFKTYEENEVFHPDLSFIQIVNNV